MPQENWTNIHKDFAQKKKYWEERGFTYKEAKEWIESDATFLEYELAIYLGEKGYEAKLANLQEFRNQFWLDKAYPIEERNKIILLNIESKNLTGSLKLEGFSNLEELNCSNNRLTSLEITNCPKLKVLRCLHNQLNWLVIDKCLNLTFISCTSNQLTGLDFLSIEQQKKIIYLDLGSNNFLPQDLSCFTSLVNLEELRINDNSFFGSLEPLQKLKKLRILGIKGNKISESWEYLNKNVKEISLGELETLVEKFLSSSLYFFPRNLLFGKIINETRFDETKNTRKQELQFYRRTERIITTVDSNIYYNLQFWRQDQLGYQNLKQTLLKINPHLDINEIIDKFDFFNAKTGSFHGDLNNLLFFFSLNQEETNFLKKTIETLTKELKNYKQKIVKAYCSFAPEKELLKELINAELEYWKSKEQKQSSIKLKKEKEKLFDELIEKIGEEQMEEVETILTDCNNLVRTELELESKINCNKLIEDFRKEFTNLNITINHHGNITASDGAIVVSGAIVSESLNIQSHNKLIKSSKRTKRDSWEESSTTRNKIEELNLMEIEQVFQPQIQISPKSN